MLLKASTSTNAPASPVVNFPPSHWKYVLKLLGLIIVADKIVLKEEVDEFLDVVVELRAVIDPTVSLTRHMARDWFILNKSGLEEIIDNLAYDTALCEILAPIKSMPHKLDVISGMVRIAVSDDVFADIEKGLIKKTILYWNVGSNAQDDLDYSVAPRQSEKA